MQEYKARIDKAVKIINQRGLDGLVIYSSDPCVMAHPSYFYYFSGLRPIGSNNAIVVSKTGDTIHLVEQPWNAVRASKKEWISHARGSSNFAKDLGVVMGELKISGTVGVLGSKEMSSDVYLAVSQKASIKPSDDIIEEVAKEKTQREIENVRDAGRITDVGFKAFFENTRVGIKEYELAAEIGFAMQSAGSEDNFILLSSGKSSYEMHAPIEKRLEYGDIIIAEITPVCEGQFIQFCATIALGKPSPVLVEKYDMLVKAHKEALKYVKPGLPASEMAKAINKVISDAGYAKYCYPPYMRARGHGLGPGSISPGHSIDDGTKATFENGQVAVIHPNQWLPETGYLACGETVLITGSGYDRLVETEIKLYVKE